MSCWVNGRRGCRIDARDRGVQYGDGLFETLRVRRGGLRLLDYHLERLAEGCSRLRIAAPDATPLRTELLRIAATRREGVLKLVVTRGVGRRGYRPEEGGRSTRIVSLHPLPPAARLTIAVPARARVCGTRLGTNPALAGLKTLNRLECVLARSEWRDLRIWEGLMRDADDNFVCGTLSNFFIRRGTLLLTPLLDRCGVAGVMRRWVLAQSEALKLKVRIGRLQWAEVGEADEAFMTNAVMGVVPLAALHHGRSLLRFPETSLARTLCCRLDAS